MSKSFYVLERDGRYVAIFSEENGAGGFISTPGWVDDVKDARHWQDYTHADDIRRNLPHPYWMADPVEHAWIDAEEYAEGLAAEIAKWKAVARTAEAKSAALALEAEGLREIAEAYIRFGPQGPSKDKARSIILASSPSKGGET